MSAVISIMLFPFVVYGLVFGVAFALSMVVNVIAIVVSIRDSFRPAPAPMKFEKLDDDFVKFIEL